MPLEFLLCLQPGFFLLQNYAIELAKVVFLIILEQDFGVQFFVQKNILAGLPGFARFGVSDQEVYSGIVAN